MTRPPARPSAPDDPVAVGVVGVGRAGAPVARRLLAAGHEVHVCDRAPAATAGLAEEGAQCHATPASLAAAAELVLVFVATDEDVLDACLGAGGIVGNASQQTTLVLCSTIAPSTCQRVARAAAGGDFAVLDATFTGGVAAAERGELTLFVGGTTQALARVERVLATFSASINHLGPIGSGTQAKLLSTAIHWGQVAVIVEAFRVAAAAGIDVSAFRTALTRGSVDGRTLRELERLTFLWHEKDLANATNSAADLGLSMPITSVVAGEMRAINQERVDALLTSDEVSGTGSP